MTRRQIGEGSIIDTNRWLDEYGGYLFRYAKSRVRSDAAAEDLVQETFLTGLKSTGSFRGNSSEKSWLTGILKNKILEYFRKQSRESPIPPAETENDVHSGWFDGEGHWNREITVAGMEWEPDPSVVLDRKEFWGVLQQCLSHLPERTASAFIQREMDFLTSSEVIENLNISEANLWVLLHRARNQLRLCLQWNWIERSKDRLLE